MELAALAGESGHSVTLWEAGEQLGGQLRVAALAPSYEKYGEYLSWQEARLRRIGVQVELGHRATAEQAATAGADVVAVATGARPHVPEIPGVDLPQVMGIQEVLTGAVTPGRHVLIVAQDDHLPPLATADALSRTGKEVTLVYGPAQPAQLLGRYIIGGILARLYKQGVQFRHHEEVVGLTREAVQVRNVYSQHTEQLPGWDSVVLACGGDSESKLHQELAGRVNELHLLGDAFAPRRLVFATRQAFALAEKLREPAQQ
jgi:NADPH-dependent 2,4-dienoyl-CoA reductase/sulfur reductase-like enzyme